MTPRRHMPALLLLFVGSGCAALIYEIVWFQLLQLVIGSSAISLGVLLGTFMGGMCLGSLLLPRFVGTDQHPLQVYAYLELGIARLRPADPVRDAAASAAPTRRSARPGSRPGAARHRGRDLPAAADAADGRDAAGDLALGEVHARRHVVARLLLRRQHRRRRARVPARRLLPDARLRHGDRDLRRGRAEHPRRRHRADARRPHGLRAGAGRNRQDRPRAGRVGDLRRDRPLGPHGARIRSAVDAHAVAALRRDHLHLLADPRRVPVRSRHRQQRRLRDRRPHGASAAGARLVPDAAVRRDGVDVVHADGVAAVLADQSVDQRRPPKASGTRSSSTSSARCGRCSRPRPCGARASRSPWPRSPRGARIRRAWSAASTPPTRSAPSPARSAAACCSPSGSAPRSRSRR